MIKTARWVHGNAFQPEDLTNITRMERKGWGLEVWGKPDSIAWFHVPVITPVIIDNERLKLGAVFVLYTCTSTPPPHLDLGGSRLLHLYIYDGKEKIKEFPYLQLCLDGWTIEPHIEIYYGLGLSVCVEFKPFANNYIEPVQFTFHTAGADFY
jgi:hypothetical protein